MSLASYASYAYQTKGRRVDEPASPTRSCFQRDRDRIVHATSFRRLKHKTQVFIYHEDDHYRTRLTHSLEVAQISRALARSLSLDEDLSEALALAHDLGHTPFGHAGEDALNAVMAPYGGFDHNAQSFRIVTSLERHYACFDGLNLSWETLEGLIKHNGPLIDDKGQPMARYGTVLPYGFTDYEGYEGFDLHSFASGEAQAAAIADDIAYNSHDLDDGLRGGFFTLDDLKKLPLLGDLIEEVDGLYPNLEPRRRVGEFIRRFITQMVEDVLQESARNISLFSVGVVDDFRKADRTLITFSGKMMVHVNEIKAFLFDKLYRHGEVLKMRDVSLQCVEKLFKAFHKDPFLMPQDWIEDAHFIDDKTLRARLVGDYIAGMTDRYALKKYEALFDEKL